MESLGEKLKNTRLEKGLDLEQVCQDTSISLRYLEALETENFDVFPGEPYLLGFIKNYGKYLDLDVQKLISLYRALRIQEQPVPVEQLLKPKREVPKFLLPLFIALVILSGAGYGGFRLVLFIRDLMAANAPQSREAVEYVMESSSFERRFYLNDVIIVPLGNEQHRLQLVNLGEAVTIRTPGGGSVILDLSHRANVDLNNDGVHDLRITVIDFERNNAAVGALVSFFLEDSIPLFGDVTETASSRSSTIVSTIFPQPNTNPLNSAFPFTLQAQFQGYCMFRWEILNERDRRERNERYFQRTEELSIQAQNGIRIWASNAQAARFQVIGAGRSVPLEIGAPGEVVVVDIRWVRDEDGRFRLVLIRQES